MAAVVGRPGGRRLAEKETQRREGGESVVAVVARLQGLQKGYLPVRLRQDLWDGVSRERGRTVTVGRVLGAGAGQGPQLQA